MVPIWLRAHGSRSLSPNSTARRRASCARSQPWSELGLLSALEEQYPATHGLEVELTHQPCGVGRPPGRCGVVTEVSLVDESELKGHAGRLDRVDRTEHGVGLLSSTRRPPDFSQPPQRATQPE